MNAASSTTKKVPGLRFPGFSEEWVVKKIGEIAKISSGGTPSRTNPTYWNGNIPWITTSQINHEQINSASQYITKEGLHSSAAKLFSPGVILMALYGQGLTRGRVAILAIEATTNQACAAIIVDEKVANTHYVFQELEHRYESLRNLSNDGSQKNLSGELVKNFKVKLPSLNEQREIASFLVTVDDKISALQRKNVLLENYKKSTMQAIFSQTIRFKDKHDKVFSEWREMKLSYFLSLPNKKKVIDIHKNKILTVKLHRKGIFVSTNTSSLKIGATTYYQRNAGEFIYGKQNLFNGALGLVPNELDGYLSSSDIPSLIINISKISPQFLMAYVGRKTYYKKLESVASGSGSKRIPEKTLLDQSINVPCLQEQQKIANLLSSLDDRIDLTTKELEQAKQFKKGLIQQMFV